MQCVSTEIHLLHQTSSAHFKSLHPPLWSQDTPPWHLLICRCCYDNPHVEAASLPSSRVHFLNVQRAALCRQIPSVFRCSPLWCGSSDAIPVQTACVMLPIPPSLLLPNWRWNGPAAFMLSQLSSACLAARLLPPSLRNLCCRLLQGQHDLTICILTWLQADATRFVWVLLA